MPLLGVHPQLRIERVTQVSPDQSGGLPGQDKMQFGRPLPQTGGTGRFLVPHPFARILAKSGSKRFDVTEVFPLKVTKLSPYYNR